MITQLNAQHKQIRRWGNIVFLSDEPAEVGKHGAPTMHDMNTMEAVAMLSAALEEALDKVRMEENGTPIMGVSFDEDHQSAEIASVPFIGVGVKTITLNDEKTATRNDQKTIILGDDMTALSNDQKTIILDD